MADEEEEERVVVVVRDESTRQREAKLTLTTSVVSRRVRVAIQSAMWLTRRIGAQERERGTGSSGCECFSLFCATVRAYRSLTGVCFD